MGDRQASLRQAVEALGSHPCIEVVRSSKLYETEPVGFKEQDPFLNSVLGIRTCLSPHDLLDAVHQVEDEMGRVRTMKWGPRVIDIDILIYNNAREESERLVIPHPRMLERAFVLVPLAEIAPDLELPGGQTARESLRALPNNEKAGVTEYATP
jgi:2-amino-4-hydroxy-6-hydroxymethyldihydropteridine diphosphokinase